TLEALWRAYRDRGLVVVGVSVDRGAPATLIDPYVRNLALTFPILLDPDSKAAGAWRVVGLPSTFVVRPGGDVAGVAVGAREWNSAEMKALLESLLPRSQRALAGSMSALIMKIGGGETPPPIPPHSTRGFDTVR